MDQDDAPAAPKSSEDELAKYKLDEYDKESSSIGGAISVRHWQDSNPSQLLVRSATSRV
jgi:hypothetical protein